MYREVDQERFQRALKPIRVWNSSVSLLKLQNHFHALNKQEERSSEEITLEKKKMNVENKMEGKHRGGGEPPTKDGWSFSLECKEHEQHQKENEVRNYNVKIVVGVVGLLEIKS